VLLIKKKKGFELINYVGTTIDDEKIYSLSEEYGIDESGMIVKIDNERDTFVFTKFYADIKIKENTTLDEIRSKIVDLRKAQIDGYLLNLFDFTIDGEEYIQLLRGSSEEEIILEKIKSLPLQHQFFARNKDVIAFLYLSGNSVVIKKDNHLKFHKDNNEEGNKKLMALLKSVSCQFDRYEDYNSLKKSGDLNF